MKNFKPMLSATIDVVNMNITYPVIVSPKLDGIRCAIIDGKALTRNLKPIPNKHIRAILENSIPNLDGELISGNFQESTSAIMTHDGEPEFEYHIFDCPLVDAGFMKRYEYIKSLKLPNFIKVVEHIIVYNERELLDYEKKCLKLGYEGVMIRSIDGKYKFGRATLKEGYLSKLKRFKDSEATIIGYEPLYKNTNEAKINALGHSERSTHKDGKVAQEKLGAWLVSWNGLDFSIGSGFTDEMRIMFWKNKEKYIGKLAKFKYQEFGVKEAPRFPVFIGIRSKKDI